MLTLSNLSPHPGSRKQRKRVGRGQGTGQGKTAARGHKGAKSRAGASIRPGFEGGQMPLQRRLPKRGFNNIFKKQFAVVNVKDLNRFDEGARIDRETLVKSGLIAKKDQLVKVLGDGEITKAITVSVDKVSETAAKKIKAAGGTVEA